MGIVTRRNSVCTREVVVRLTPELVQFVSAGEGSTCLRLTFLYPTAQ